MGSGWAEITMVILFSPFILHKTTHDFLIVPMIDLLRRGTDAPRREKIAEDGAGSGAGKGSFRANG
jgi:hypothetical protein